MSMKKAAASVFVVLFLVILAGALLCASPISIQQWLHSTTQITIHAHGPDSSNGLQYIKVRDSDVAGYILPNYATHGFLSNGQEIVAIPVGSGGSMGVNASLLFTVIGGRRRFVGYIPSPEGHLDVSIREGRLAAAASVQ